KFLRFLLRFYSKQNHLEPTRSEARPPQAADLTFAKFGSNFFVNLDQKRKGVRREALFIFCRELPIR
ncbi:hypothetical protein KJ678_03195, partial [Patescibacteria group bacterium]|nr:hypothetical protein [Patescibacteria group bacterium]